MKQLIGTTTVAFVLAALGTAHADVSEKVQKSFRGQILITDGALPGASATDAATISKYKQVKLGQLKHVSEEDGVATWHIDYTAFLKKAPKVRQLSFDFYTDDKEKLFVANKGLMGIDPLLKIVRGNLSINEDDGVNRNRSYIIKLTGKVGKREFTFAETKLELK